MILTTIATLSQSQQSARLTGSKIKQTNSVSISAHLCGDRKGKMSVACRCDCGEAPGSSLVCSVHLLGEEES